MDYDEFEDVLMDWIQTNVYPAGDELEFHRNRKEKIKELYEMVKK
jgi:hypothetical protein